MKKIILLFTLLLALLYGRAQSLTLDPSFAGRGWTYTAFDKGSNLYGSDGHQVLLQNDGSYLLVLDVGGNTVLARYRPDGSLEESYGTGGYSTGVYLYDGRAAQQSDGRVVVAGSYGDNEDEPGGFVVVRFRTDGSLDSSWGENGKVITPFFGNWGYANAVAIQKDGRIVVAGEVYNPETTAEFALARYHADGSLDNSFGIDGKLTTNFGGSARAQALVLQSDGKIVAGGNAWVAGAPYNDFALARYHTDGTLDNAFDGDGKVTTELGGVDLIYSLALQADGRIVAGGSSRYPNSNNSDVALVRYNSDGTLDNSFSGDGKVVTDLGGFDNVYSVALQEDGKIVAGGYADNGNRDLADFAAVRYNSDGTLDHTFGGDGVVTTALHGRDQAFSLVMQPDGKVVLVGNTQAYPSFEYALTRYNSDGSLDNSFDQDGVVTGYYPVGQYGLNAVAVQSDGKIVVAGITYDGQKSDYYVSLARYNREGTLDPSFSGDGVLVTDLTTGSEDVFVRVVLSDGKIVVAGNLTSDYPQTSDVVLARYNSDGTLDGSFGSDGKVVTDFGGFDQVADLTLQDDGKLVVVGSTQGEDGRMDFVLARYNSDGSLDNSFDGDGIVVTDFAGLYDYATSLAIQPDGKIVAAGWAFQFDGSDPDFALARYNSDGSLDNSFDGDGKVMTDFGENLDAANAVALQSDGKIVVAGRAYTHNTVDPDFALARYNSDGSLDLSFSSDGKVMVDFWGGYDEAYSLALQSDGKIILTGSAQGTEDYGLQDVALARFNSNGSLDDSFDEDGKQTTDFTGRADAAFASYLDGDRLYIAGFGAEMPSYKGLLAAYRLDCMPYYRDSDGDGYGDAAQKLVACTAPTGYVANNTDCNDNNAALHPGAQEVCANRRDDNCDGQINEGCPGLPYLTINDVAVDEADGTAVLTVRLSKKAEGAVTARYFTVDKTASSKYLAGTTRDYKAASGLLTFAAGSQSATITVKIMGDNLFEGDEYFNVMLYRPLGASIYDVKGRVTIRDAAPAVTRASAGAQELAAGALSVQAQPNPSSRYFTLVVHSGGNGPVSLRVMDALGRLVEARSGLAPNTTLQLGRSYRPGVYYAEVVQGGERVLLPLVKGDQE